MLYWEGKTVVRFWEKKMKGSLELPREVMHWIFWLLTLGARTRGTRMGGFRSSRNVG